MASRESAGDRAISVSRSKSLAYRCTSGSPSTKKILVLFSRYTTSGAPVARDSRIENEPALTGGMPAAERQHLDPDVRPGGYPAAGARADGRAGSGSPARPGATAERRSTASSITTDRCQPRLRRGHCRVRPAGAGTPGSGGRSPVATASARSPAPPAGCSRRSSTTDAATPRNSCAAPATRPPAAAAPHIPRTANRRRHPTIRGVRAVGASRAGMLRPARWGR